MKIIPIQRAFDKEIPDNILGNLEYAVEVDILQNIDRLLIDTGAEEIVVRAWLENAERELAGKNSNGEKEPARKLSDVSRLRIQENAVFTLRAAVLRKYRDLSYRELARELALAPLYQWFCGLNRWVDVRIPSKSKLQSDEQALPEELLRELNSCLMNYSMIESGEAGALEIEDDIDLSECFFDTFCLRTNIHYPVDWVLLRDASRSLMLAVINIRKYDIKNRMVDGCEYLLRGMNKLCIQMTHSYRQKGGKKMRKRCFRKMKKLVRKIEKHARLHLAKLREKWPESDLCDGEVVQIEKRINNILEQLPEAIRQGHERIIGGRLIKSEDKILSLYEDGVNVIVRRKAGAESEFGNKVSLMEQKQGLIIDWGMAEEGAPGDPGLCRKSYDRVKNEFGSIGSLTTDRGCTSPTNSKHFVKYGTYDATCPRSVDELSLRMNDEEFRKLQKRRGSTEARISILQKFTGGKLKCKGYEHRRQQFGLCVFAHNLWLLSRLRIAAREEREREAAKKAG